MSDLSYDEVRKILALFENSTLDEIHVEFGDFKLEAHRRGSAAPVQTPAPATSRKPVGSPAPGELAPGQFALVAPMLGTFYRAPSPDAPPFVEVGNVVSAGEALCIIEVMKLMNTIKAERPGRVAAILADNAVMVEFAQTLMVFDPA